VRFLDEVVRRLPFRIEVLQTDNGAEFQSKFHWHAEELLEKTRAPASPAS
jgi:hypothetical protein